jgi:hypothetical protein
MCLLWCKEGACCNARNVLVVVQKRCLLWYKEGAC